MGLSSRHCLLLLFVFLLCVSSAQAFGAGNIASISAVEGKNWRHGDIEDILKQVACIRHHKWNSMMMKRVYFGNWLRDYSQAMDTGALKKAQPETIRVLVWLLSFLGFGYATAEFEVTRERLGVYRPEEHIDNPKDYNDNEDARKFDPRLRAPVQDIELAVDPDTGMKNYIAKKDAHWATSAAFVKWSFEQSIHHGRQYCAGRGIFKGNDDELAEACRLLGQGLHTLEDFGAHTNYVELVLREMGMHNVFPHVGERAMINVRGKHIFPLVTGTFGMVDFYHSVLGEATDHFTQSEISEMDNAMGMAQTASQSNNPLMTLVKLLSKVPVPGAKDLCDEAQRLQANSQRAAQDNQSWGSSRGVDDNYSSSRSGPGDWNQGYQQQGGYDQGYQQQGGYNQGYQQESQRGWGDPAYDAFLQNQQHQQQGNWQQPPAHQQQGNWQQPPAHQQQNWQQPPQQQSWQQPHEMPGSTNWNQQPPVNSQPQQTPSQPQQKPQAGPDGKLDSSIDPAKLVQQIYPILAFRDKVVRAISSVIEKIPGLEALVERIVETLTVFILSLLAPIIRPIINTLTKSLEAGSEGVVSSNGKHQFDVWNDPTSTDPTHSMLSKDHFSNILNDPAGDVAAEILKFIAPRILYAWEHPGKSHLPHPLHLPNIVQTCQPNKSCGTSKSFSTTPPCATNASRFTATCTEPSRSGHMSVPTVVDL
jgi:hypothetical protein